MIPPCRLSLIPALAAMALAGAFPAPSGAAPAELAPIAVIGDDPDDPRVFEGSTATRTATPLREVPQTVDTVKVPDALNYGARTLGEALAGVPNVTDASDTRFDGLRIRGFDAGSDFYLDGVRDDSQYVRDLHNIERIEVLKGPAGVLYGRGSQGGIVNRVSKAPGPGRASTLEVRLGGEDFRSLYADLSADPSDTVSLRLNVGGENAGSFRHGVSSRRRLASPALAWRITPRLDWLAQYEHSRYDRVPDRGIPSVDGRPAPVGRSTVYGDPGRDNIDDRVQVLRSRLRYRAANGWELRHTLSTFRLHSDFDNTYLSGWRAETGLVQRQRWQQHLRARHLYNVFEAEGTFATGWLEHRLLAGVELGSQHRDPTLHRAATKGPGAQPVPGLALHHPDLSQQHHGRMERASDARHRVRTQGYYLQDQLRLSESWQVVAGARLDRFGVRTRNRLLGLEGSRGDRSVSPRLGVVWTPWPAHAFYASYSKTFSPTGGGTIGITPDARGNANDLPPEHTRQYEAGVKSDWLDGRLSTMLAVYQLELYNRRTRAPHDPTRILLTGLQRSRGLEMSGAGRLAVKIQ
ncbi:TonB-dependent receptor [Bordetella pertussis]|uniref:TonB-dependent siderophore receptor n=8 Tax=Bordetella pertussis TaxID=520 RepID=A0AAI9IYX4_BORPT|nr:TonB-dependent receptor [Bordetella pertussis]ETH38402.1 TonB-dependent siderophore receptor [Bordetella pertussis H918]ETH41376.1 TonB-dependent siderophore receptor [Bordetella pertussis H939]ETH45952.1 TonB-dependent siderophore receptor [Bordetella pertussis H921]ETH72702.1 TonB-dependent siderophore receptor [Bordetella pertussis STO1-CHLA-0011]ETH86272.1 TonB-dependent siderophore receptor [Bordetella pertussis STO1-CHOC-0018]ETH91673.1 TonB-dependent siderophore receptor [Bordetella